MTHGNVLATPIRALVLSVLTAACCLVLQSTAHAEQINTFKGTCTQVPVVGKWPNPLKFTPQDGDFFATLDGGSCTGVLNGQPVQNVPVTGQVNFHGIQSCGGAELQGRAHTVIGGKDFYADALERRAGRDAFIVANGDTSGQTVIKAYGRIGLFKEDFPLSQEPFVRPFIEPTDAQEFFAACSGPGLTQVNILIEIGASPAGFSSPASEPHWESGAP